MREQLDADMAEIATTSTRPRLPPARLPSVGAARVAEVDTAGENEPVIHEPQAEPELEPSWRPGDSESYHQTEAQAPEESASLDIP